MITTCPSETVLRQFNEGRIEDLIEIDRITEHLGRCDTCINMLESMEPCPISEGLRQSVSNQLVPDDTKSRERELDLNSMPGSVDQAISNIESMLPDEKVDPAEYGENRYQVIGSIGEGDFGCVFGALTDESGTTEEPQLVGIKIPHASKLPSRRHSEQFFDDCQKAKSLQHPGIQSILEFGQWDESRLFFAKPLIQFPTLTRFVKNSPRFTQESMLSIFRQLVDAVQYAHQQNVIHRHLTPNNIHVIVTKQSESGETAQTKQEINVVISDFGFVLDSRYHFDLIEPPSLKTPFISPESATLNAEYIDERTDIYSLGKNLKLLLRFTDDPRDDERIKKIIDKSTYVRRRDRYQTVSELVAALELI